MQPNPVPNISVTDIPENAFLLDVREPDEWAAGHAPNATHIPMADVPARFTELPEDVPIVVTCRAGGRSSRAVAWLQSQGIETAVNLDGGMQSWQAYGRPLVAESDGNPQVL